jgi:hypothetical protein
MKYVTNTESVLKSKTNRFEFHDVYLVVFSLCLA